MEPILTIQYDVYEAYAISHSFIKLFMWTRTACASGSSRSVSLKSAIVGGGKGRRWNWAEWRELLEFFCKDHWYAAAEVEVQLYIVRTARLAAHPSHGPGGSPERTSERSPVAARVRTLVCVDVRAAAPRAPARRSVAAAPAPVAMPTAEYAEYNDGDGDGEQNEQCRDDHQQQQLERAFDEHQRATRAALAGIQVDLVALADRLSALIRRVEPRESDDGYTQAHIRT